MEIKSAFIIGALLAAMPALANDKNNKNMSHHALNNPNGKDKTLPVANPVSVTSPPLNAPIRGQRPFNQDAIGVNVNQISIGNVFSVVGGAGPNIIAGSAVNNARLSVSRNIVAATAIGNSSVVIIKP